MKDAQPKTPRHNINLDPETVASLREVKYKNDLPYVQVVKRAVAMFMFVMRNQEKGGSAKAFDKDGKVVLDLHIK